MIRVAKPEDAEPIAGIIIEAWKYAYTGIIEPNYPDTMNHEKYTEIMVNNIIQHKETIFVNENHGLITGFISGKEINNTCDCETIGLYVLPDYQNTGIGKTLLDTMKKYFQNRGCKSMVIWTLKNARNNNFYKKQGGSPEKEKEITIGDKQYRGTGFVFNL